MGKKKNKVLLEVIGGNCESVTGSCTRINYDNNNVLFEFGMIQDGHTILEDYRLNKQLLSKIKAKEIKMVIIGHCHLDHTGLIPALFKQHNYDIRIIVPQGSYGILEEMWKDSASILQRNVDTLNLRSDLNLEPFYTQDEIAYALTRVEEVSSNEIIRLDDSLSIRYTPAGHILHSQQTEMFISSGSHTRKILFTSDLGNTVTQNSRVFIEKFQPVSKANIVIGECTYSKSGRSMTKKDYEKDIEKIKSVVQQFCIDSKNRVLIPSFSLDRTPYILWILYTLFGHDETFTIPVLIDSPLSNRLLDRYDETLTGISKEKFQEMLRWKNVKRIVTPEDSQSAMLSDGAKIILSSSGMLTAGRSVKWTQSVLPCSNDCILFMGYAGSDTLAYKIKNNRAQKTISINGVPIKNKCQIVDLKSFSSHMQRNDLINYYKSIVSDKIYLVHSNANDKLEFKKDLENAISECCKTTRVIAVNKSTKISL